MENRTSRKVVIHAGFHRTATKTIQKTFQANQAKLVPVLELRLKPELRALSSAAIAYDEAPSEKRHQRLLDAAVDALKTIDPRDPRPLLISNEDIIGAFPHRKGRVGYQRAEKILETVLSALPDGCAPTIFLMTRGTDAWMASCYAHSLRHARTRLDETAYRAGHIGPTLAEIAKRASSAISVPFVTASLEETIVTREGPLSPLLDELGLSGSQRTSFQNPPRLNAAMPPGLLAEFLSLNRTIDDNAARKHAKRTALARWRGK